MNRADTNTVSIDSFVENGKTHFLKHRIGKTLQADGNEMLYSWWEEYRFNPDTDYLEYLNTYQSLAEISDKLYQPIQRDGENENIFTVTEENGEKTLCYKGEPIDTLPESVDYFGREYIFDDATFIYVNVYINNSPAPYTNHEEYIYVKNASGVKKLDWDVRCNLSRILPDSVGGYYLCSDVYSPYGSSRWSTEFSSVYHYTAEGDFFEVTVDGANSIRGYMVTGGRLLVEAVCYNADKNYSGWMPINPGQSGFYALDVKNDADAHFM